MEACKPFRARVNEPPTNESTHSIPVQLTNAYTALHNQTALLRTIEHEPPLLLQPYSELSILLEVVVS